MPKSKSLDQQQTSIIRLLRPIARLCLRYSLKIQEIQELFKRALLSAAAEELAKQGHQANTSRLALATGLQRKDVQRMLLTDRPTITNSNLITRIIGQWSQNKKFNTAKGNPRPLQFEGNESEFSDLVRSLSTDLNPYSVLFELERNGLVQRSGDKLLLRSEVYALQGTQSAQQAFEMIAADVADLIDAVQFNLSCDSRCSTQGENIPHLQARTEYDNICPEYAAEIRNWLLNKGSQFHKEVRNYLAQFDKDTNSELQKKPGRIRIAVSTFSFSDSSQGEH